MFPAVEILFVTTELAPYSVAPNAPEAADAAASLPKALRGLGHRVTVVSPLYKGIDPTTRSLARRLSVVNVKVLGKSYACQLYDGRTTGGVDLLFLGNAELFAEQLPGQADAETRLRSALLLGGAAAQLANTREPRVDVLHARGAGSATAIALAKQLRPELACSLTLQDGEDPLRLTPAQLAELPEELRAAAGTSDPSLLHAGIARADAVVTGASSTQRDLLESSPLAGVLREKGSRFVNVLNGVDASVWNPLIDSLLSARFDATNLGGKARCKGSLQYMLGLGVKPEIPLLTFIGDLSDERGGDLIAEFARDCMRNEIQLCVLGSECGAASKLRALAEDLPERLALRTSHDEKERHLALGASDFLLLPAREPRSLEVALSALRYGALPIVRPIGVLADVIVDTDAKLETGNGFVLEGSSPEELLATVQRALAGYARSSAFEVLRKRAMRHDVSWERSARRYEHLFKQAQQASQPAA